MRAVMVVPTYNEVTNLGPMLARLRAAQPDLDVLVVDDESPDGTGALADDLAGADAQVHVLHRAEKQGLGRAYLDGFAWALARAYDVVGEMDADGSHQAEQLRLAPRGAAGSTGAGRRGDRLTLGQRGQHRELAGAP